jgi:hypothetical protein
LPWFWGLFIGYNLLYEASCLVVEESVLEGREHTAGRVEAGDVVVGILHAVAGGGQGSGGHDDYLEELELLGLGN